MQDAVSSEHSQEDDQAAVAINAALPAGSTKPLTWDGYPALPMGPEQSPAQIIEQIRNLAFAFRSPTDAEPASVEQILGVRLDADVQAERRGVQGKVASGTYSWAVWKPSASNLSNVVELKLSAVEPCLSYNALKDRLSGHDFEIFTPDFGDDQRVVFQKLIGESLGLFIYVTVDSRREPRCISRLSLEMGRSSD